MGYLTTDKKKITAKTFIEMKNAGEANKEQRPELVKEAVNKNLSYMHAVLNNQQYHKYLTLMNMTLANRGLNF